MVSVPCHVLIVDDEKSLRFLLRDILEIEGFEVSEATDGWAALELLQQGTLPDVILLDVLMPGLDGAGFLEQLYRLDLGAPIPIVQISADPDAALPTAAVVLEKPFRVTDVLRCIQAACPPPRPGSG